MRKLLFLAGLLALPGCPTPLRGKPPKSALARPIRLPKRVTEATFPRNRVLYASLPTTNRQRGAFRRRLLDFLLTKARAAARRGRLKRLAKCFAQAALLYDPADIYRGQKPDKQMVTLARLTMKRFSPRGDEMKVVPALVVLLSAAPDEARAKGLRGKLKQVLTWLDKAAQLTYGRNFKGARGVRVMDRTARLWSSRAVVETLRKLYVERMITLARATPMERILARRLARDPFRGLLQTGYKIARLYLRVDRPDEALERLREISVKSSQEENLRRLLEQAVAPTANVEDQIRLAEYVEEHDSDVALRVCRGAIKRFPREARAYACVGRLAAKLGIVRLAVRSYETAHALEPRRRAFAEKLARQYQRELALAVNDDRLKSAGRQLAAIERFYSSAKARYGSALRPPISKAYIAVGHGLFNAGRVVEAAGAFRKSIKSRPTTTAYVQLATMAIRSGKGAAALTQLTAAEKLPKRSIELRTFWQGRIEALRGDAYELLGKTAEAAAARRRSVGVWDLFLQNKLVAQFRAQAYVWRGRALYALGEVGRALDTFDKAIDSMPSRKETYAAVIALLVRHGHLPEALDAYHRALGRDEVGEYLKTYCSLWVVGLARRGGKSPDPLAIDFLKNLTGGKWYVRLSRAVLDGSFAALAKKTKRPSHLAELAFYWADWLLARGKKTEAERLWKKVVDSRMMAFFEYDIAWYNLRHGAPKVRNQPVDRQSNSTRAGRGP